jgi:hypothetical protein
MHRSPHADVTERALPALAALSLLSNAVATTLGNANGSYVCQAQPAAVRDSALLWAASLRGWSEGPTVRAWRHFVAWTKQSRHPAGTCAPTRASLA